MRWLPASSPSNTEGGRDALELLANPKQLPDPQANRERPPVRPLHRGHACGLLLSRPSGRARGRRLTNSTTRSTTAGSRRILRCPRPSVVTSGASIDSAKSTTSAYAVCRSPRSVITSVGSALDVPGLDAGVELGHAHADELVDRVVERGPDPRAEAERPLELVEQRRGLDHGSDEHQALGPEPAVAQREVGRDRAHRVRDDRLGRPEAAEDGVQGLGELHPVGPSRSGRSVVGVAVRRRVEHDHAVAGLHERRHHRAELGATTAPPVHQVDGPGSAVAPDEPTDRVALRLDLERPAPLRAPGSRPSAEAP